MKDFQKKIVSYRQTDLKTYLQTYGQMIHRGAPLLKSLKKKCFV